MASRSIVLQGSPTYYCRFGFEWSVPLGITMELPDWAPREAAQVRRLAAYDPTIRGEVVLPPAFDGCRLSRSAPSGNDSRVERVLPAVACRVARRVSELPEVVPGWPRLGPSSPTS